MRLVRVRLIAVCCAALAVLAAACGGGSSNAKALDVSRVPTATLPASLPEPKIIGSGAAQPGGGSAYTVKDGDTLAGIATRFGVSLEDLRAANPNIDGASLSIGQAIRLPAATDAPAGASSPAPTKEAATAVPAEPTSTEAPAPTAAAPTPVPPPVATETPSSLGQTYTVQEGDIPVTIAAKFGITVEELLAANPGVDPTGLHIGQVLVIPPKRDG